MGFLDKAKFWKKEDDLSDLSDLGDFGIDEGRGSEHNAAGNLGNDLGPLDSADDHTQQASFGSPARREEVQQTQRSREMGEQLGIPVNIEPAAPNQRYQQSFQQQVQQPAPQAAQQQQFYQGIQQPGQQNIDLVSLSKDIEIIHAKLDAIKSSLDAINQRLATIERIAYGEGKNKYVW